jgi:hypothetical protein
MNRQTRVHGDEFLEANKSLSGEHVPMEMDTWKPVRRCMKYKRFLGYEYTMQEDNRIAFRWEGGGNAKGTQCLGL